MDDYDQIAQQLTTAIKNNDKERAAEAAVWMLTTFLRNVGSIAASLEQISLTLHHRSN